jgi:hypothetical protein
MSSCIYIYTYSLSSQELMQFSLIRDMQASSGDGNNWFNGNTQAQSSEKKQKQKGGLMGHHAGRINGVLDSGDVLAEQKY